MKKTILLFIIVLYSSFAENYFDNSVYFVRNIGQWDSNIISKVRIGKMSAYITQNGIVYNFYNLNKDTVFFNKLKNKDFSSSFSLNNDKSTVTGHNVKMSFEGAEQNPKEYKGLGLHNDYNNYYIGGDSTKWKTRVPLYDEIIVKNMYDGIDVRYYFENAEIDNKKSVSLRYDFIIHPGADPTKIKMKFEGQDALAVNGNGELIIHTSLGEVKQCKLYAYQTQVSTSNIIHSVNSASVECSFSLNSDGLISFKVGEYNKDLALVIDPLVMLWSTYYGGQGEETIYYDKLTVDSRNNVYFVGSTLSNDSIATPGAYQSTKNQSIDGYFVKFNSDGVRQWGSYYGGEEYDQVCSIGIDSFNNVFIAGHTNSTTGIATAGAYKETLTINALYRYDAYLAKFTDAGTRVWATYYGGHGYESGNNITIDANNNIILVGQTDSTDGIATIGTEQPTFGGNIDGYIAKFDNNGNFLWGTYCGGEQGDLIRNVKTDNNGNIYVVGAAGSLNNIVTANAHQTTFGGAYSDGFLIKYNSQGIKQWGTYYGGESDERCYGIAIDMQGFIYINGWTWSQNNIAGAGAYQSTKAGLPPDAFIAKFNSNGVRQWGTYYGGESSEECSDIQTDKYNNVYIVGSTLSLTGISTSGTYNDNVNGEGTLDGFIAKFNSNGKIQWGTYLGGTRNDYGFSIAIDNANDFIVYGKTTSVNFPVLNAHQPYYSQNAYLYYDSFLSKFKQTNEGLVGYWPFCGNADDKSGNNNHGTVHGATLTNDRFGNPGQAYLFDGINDYIEIPDAPVLNIQSSITMSSWVKTTASQTDRDYCIIGKWDGSTNYYHKSYNQLLRNGKSGGSVQEINGILPGDDNHVFGDRTVNNGQWNHIVYTADNPSHKIRIYVNGIFDKEFDFQASGSDWDDIMRQCTSRVLIGIRDLIFNDGTWFDGYIDDIRLYNYAMSGNEVSELFQLESKPAVTVLNAVPDAVVLGDRTCLNDTTITITLNNTAATPLNITQTYFSKGINTKWELSNGGVFTLPAGGTRKLTLKLKTTAAGNLNDTLKFAYPDECSPVLWVPVSGYRDTIGVKLSVSDTVALGKICQNSSLIYAIDVHNISSRATSFNIAKNLVAPFELVAPNPFDKIFNLNGTKTLKIQFTAKDLGFYYQDIIISDSCGKETKVTLKAEVYLLKANAGPDQSVCENDSVRIGVDDHAGLASNKYSWSPKTGLASPDSLLTMASPDKTTDYILTITDANGCTAKDTVRVMVTSGIDVKISPGDTAYICPGYSVRLSASPSGTNYKYMWSNGSTESWITVKTSGIYSVIVTNENGCTGRDSIVVFEIPPLQLKTDKAILDFGALDACDSQKLDSILITNLSNAYAVLYSIESTEPAFQLVSPLPSVKIKSKLSQSFKIKFSPKTEGDYSGELLFISLCNDTFKLTVKGRKINAGVNTDLTEIDFGTNCKPLTIDTTITIYNKTKSIVTLLEPITSTPFSIISPSFPVTLNSLGEIQVKVRYAPTTEGIYNSISKFPYQSSACPDDTISVIVKGSVQTNTLETPELIVMPQLCECEIPKDTVITITNKSSVADTIYKITTDENVGYSTPTPLPIIIEPGKSVQLTIKWNPQNIDSVTSVITLFNQPCDYIQKITITGWKNGIGFYPPDSIIFNELVLCRDTIEIQELTLKNKNCSQETARIISYNINSSAFSIDINPNDTLPFDGYKTYHLRYSPKTEADTSAVLEIRYMPCDTVKKIILKGKITGPVLSINDVDYGYIPLNQTKSKQIEIKNEGTIADTIYEINGVVLPFSYDPASPSFPIIIEPGKAFTFSVKYTPQAMRNDTILITAKMKPCDLLANAELTGNCASIPKTVVFIDTASAEVGSETVMNLLMTNGLNLSYYGITDYEATFRYNATVLCPKEPFAADHDSIAFDERIMKISGKIPAQLNGTQDTLRAMRFTAALGNAECSEMKLDTVLLYGGAYEIKLLNGRFCLSNICKEGGKRLFYGSGKTELLSIIPNPADEEITIILNTIEEGETYLNIYNSIGMKVYESNIINTKTGVKEISINTSNLSTGVYFIKLQTPTVSDYQKLLIER